MSRHLRKKKVAYKTCLVTYLDILGFRDLLRSETAGRISRILRIVKEASRSDKETECDFERLYESFSDLTLRSIVVSSAEFLLIRPGLLLYELESIARVQIELIQREKILVRGGIAIGRLVKSWGLVFGEAMVKAYELERKAKNSRVLVDDVLVNVLTKLSSKRAFDLGISQLVATDHGYSYVDYLRYSSQVFNDWEEQAEFFWTHKQIITDGLKRFSSNKHIRAKFLWLKRYHNARVPKIPLPDFEDLYVR